MSYIRRATAENTSALPDALWWIYMIYLNGHCTNLKEAPDAYENALKDPSIPLPYRETVAGIEFLRKYLI